MSNSFSFEHYPYIVPQSDGSWLLRVRLQPSAKRSEIIGIYEGMLKIRLAAQPIENKANIALIEFIAKTLDVNKSSVELIKGTTSREKKLHIASHVSPNWSKILFS